MKTLLAAGILAATTIVAAPASATDFTIPLTSSGTSTGSGAGNSFTYTVKSSDGQTLNVRATAYTRAINTSISTAALVSWGANGLGVYQTGETDNPGYHQIDNVNGWEFIVFQFSRAVALTSATLNTFKLSDRSYYDNDAFIGRGTSTVAWDKPLDMNSFKMTGSMNSDSTKFTNTWVNDHYNTTQTFTLPSEGLQNTWIIGGSVDGPDNLNDAFKLAGIVVTTAVPEPATWGMMILGFGAVGASMRYRRRKATAAIA